MQTKLLVEGEVRTWALVFETGDAVMSAIAGFARDQQLTAGEFTAIGAFREATLGYFDPERKDYDEIPVGEQVELLSLLGRITREPEGEPNVHAPCRPRQGRQHHGRRSPTRGRRSPDDGGDPGGVACTPATPQRPGHRTRADRSEHERMRLPQPARTSDHRSSTDATIVSVSPR